jgi:uncharacterized protein YoxC
MPMTQDIGTLPDLPIAPSLEQPGKPFEDKAFPFMDALIALFNALRLRLGELNIFKEQANALKNEVNTLRNTVVEKEALVNPHYTAIDTVSTNIIGVNSVYTNIVPNLAEILQADTNANTATTKASEASASAADALAAKNAAEAAWDAFDDKWLGYHTTPPTLDNDGNPLQNGATYWDGHTLYIYDLTNTTWVNGTVNPTSHTSLSGRSEIDQHPISAITGLEEALLSSSFNYASLLKFQ